MATSTSTNDLSDIVPDTLDAAPSNILKVAYSDSISVNCGEPLTPTQVKLPPAVNWTPEDSSIYYTLIMADPDAPSRQDPKMRHFLHWLVGNIPGNKLGEGVVLADYIGSGPPKGTGLHRYIFILLKQKAEITFSEVKIPNTEGKGRGSWDCKGFINKYSLEVTAANYYRAEWDEYVPELHKQLKVSL